VGRVLCIANQKGGVGKTTTAMNLAGSLAKSGQQTLLIDLDPQCNATTGFGHRPTDRHGIVVQDELRESIVGTTVDNLRLLPGSRSYPDIEYLASDDPQRTANVRRHLLREVREFDFVLIDCPPSLGQLTQTALSVSHEVLMPIQCEYFAMEGLTQMIHLIKRVMTSAPGQLEFGGILLTMYDESFELTQEVEEEVRDFFGDIVFDTVVPRDICVAEAPSHCLTVIDYAPRSRGSRAYVELCMEGINRD